MSPKKTVFDSFDSFDSMSSMSSSVRTLSVLDFRTRPPSAG